MRPLKKEDPCERFARLHYDRLKSLEKLVTDPLSLGIDASNLIFNQELKDNRGKAVDSAIEKRKSKVGHGVGTDFGRLLLAMHRLNDEGLRWEHADKHQKAGLKGETPTSLLVDDKLFIKKQGITVLDSMISLVQERSDALHDHRGLNRIYSSKADNVDTTDMGNVMDHYATMLVILKAAKSFIQTNVAEKQPN